MANTFERGTFQKEEMGMKNMLGSVLALRIIFAEQTDRNLRVAREMI